MISNRKVSKNTKYHIPETVGSIKRTLFFSSSTLSSSPNPSKILASSPDPVIKPTFSHKKQTITAIKE